MPQDWRDELQATLAKRPAHPVGGAGSRFWATDTSGYYRWDGAQWWLLSLSSSTLAQGTFALRPAAGSGNRVYFATDTERLFWDNGTRWVATDEQFGFNTLDYSSLSATVAAALANGSFTVFISPDATVSVGNSSIPTLFDGIQITGAGYNSNIISSVTGTNFALGGSNLDNFLIDKVRLSGSAARIIALTSATNFKISDSYISGATVDDATNYSAGIWLNGCTDGTIELNRLSGNGITVTTTIAVGSNGVVLPAAIINVVSTTGFPASGTLAITSLDAGVTKFRSVTYTGITATSFTGCSGGTGTLSTGGYVSLVVTNRSGDIVDYVSTNTRMTIRQNKCLSTGVHFNLAAFNMVNSTIENNWCTGAVADTSNNSGYGIVCYQTLSPEGNTINTNHVWDTQGTGVYTEANPYVEVNDNFVNNCGLAQDDTTLPVGGIAINGCAEAVVNSNRIKGGNKNGIVLAGTTGNSSDNVVSDNKIFGTVEAGIRTRGDNRFATITDNSINACKGGVRIDSTATLGYNVSGNAITSTTGGSFGISAEAATQITDSIFDGNTIVDSGGYGMAILGAGTFNKIRGNTVRNSGVLTPGAYDGILFNCTDTIISNNTSTNVGTSNQQYGIQDTGTGAGVRVTGNDVTGNVTKGYNGSSAIVKDNTGFLTENTGTSSIASGTTAIAVTHGLAYTPTAKEIVINFTENPTNDPGNIWLSAIGSSQFTVNCRADPGVSNLDFSWSIRRV